jgi:hypothetical protein
MSDFSSQYEFGQSAHSLDERRFGIVVVAVVEINMVGLKPLQGLVASDADVVGSKSSAIGFEANFGGDHEIVPIAAARHPVADDGL